MRPGRIVAPLLLLASVVTIGLVRYRVAGACRAVKNTSDVFALPPPNLLVAASLGYRSALADLLFTQTLVQYGIHGEERRRFDDVGKYLDSIAALDPLFCQPYKYADTFIIFQAVGSPTPDHVRHARRLIEEGTRNCPTSDVLFTSGAQFLAFIGPQWLEDEAEKKDFQSAAARLFARSAELASSNENLQWHSLAAAGILTREGKREAAVAFLERVYAMTDSEELRAKALYDLGALAQEGAADAARKRTEAFNEVWRTSLPFVSRTRMLVVGPPWDAALCAGRPSDGAPGCAKTWATRNGP
jgi:tetratricopeptide (TPR) repeat protein